MNETIAAMSAAVGADESFEAKLGKIKTYKFGDAIGGLNDVENAARGSVGNPETRKAVSAALAAFLAGDATKDAKVFVSRQLAITGGPEIAGAIAPLLLNIETSNFSRYAIERIEGAEIDAVLIDALGKADAKSQVGIVNSLGARKSASAVPALSKLLGASDPVLAEAAAAALGHIGGADAVKALAGRVAKSARDTAANGLLESAGHAKAAGDAELAKRAYKEAASGASKAVQRAAKAGLEK